MHPLPIHGVLLLICHYICHVSISLCFIEVCSLFCFFKHKSICGIKIFLTAQFLYNFMFYFVFVYYAIAAPCHTSLLHTLFTSSLRSHPQQLSYIFFRNQQLHKLCLLAIHTTISIKSIMAREFWTCNFIHVLIQYLMGSINCVLLMCLSFVQL